MGEIQRRVPHASKPRRVIRHPPAKAVTPQQTLTLGIDQSWTGFALVAYNPATREHIDRLLKSKPTFPARRIHLFKQAIVEALRDIGEVTSVAMEGFNRGARNGREEAGALWCLTLSALFEVYGDSPPTVPVVVAPQTLKKFVTGNGHAKGKNVMLLAAYKKWGVDYVDDNLCDAYGLARVAAAVMSGTSELKYEQEVIATLKRSHTPWEPPPQPKR